MGNERVLISVIIASYNRAGTVGEAIESIVSQNVNADIEVIIGDDCSTDKVREVLEEYKQKYPEIIKLYYRDENLGLGANWAQCVKDCCGKYICNCDNDDYWHNLEKLQLQMDYMESHDECNICFTNYRTHNRNTGEIYECETVIDRKQPIQNAMFGGSNICNATVMYRADFLKQHLDLDEWINRRFSLQDWPAWVILTAYTDICILPVSTATFGIETVSITRPDSYECFELRLGKDRKVCSYLGELFPEKFPYTDEMWNRYQNTRMMKMAFRKHDFVNAKRYGVLAEKGVFRIISQSRFLFALYLKLKSIKQSISDFAQ